MWPPCESQFAERRQGRRLPDTMIPRATSPARRRSRSRGHASSPAGLALPRADRRVGLPHQAVRLMFLLGLWRSLGGLRLGTGSATGSALPSITFAASARAASISRSGSNASSSCSSDIAATAVAVGVEPSAGSSNSCLAGYARCASRGRRFPDTPERLSCCSGGCFPAIRATTRPTPAAPSPSAARSSRATSWLPTAISCEPVTRHCLWPFTPLRVTRPVQASHQGAYEWPSSGRVHHPAPQAPASAAR